MGYEIPLSLVAEANDSSILFSLATKPLNSLGSVAAFPINIHWHYIANRAYPVRILKKKNQTTGMLSLVDCSCKKWSPAIFPVVVNSYRNRVSTHIWGETVAWTPSRRAAGCCDPNGSWKGIILEIDTRNVYLAWMRKTDTLNKSAGVCFLHFFS